MSTPMQLPPPPPLRPRSVGDILSDAFDLYRKHFLTLIQVVAIVVVPLTLLQYFLADQMAENLIVRDGQIVRNTDFTRASAAFGLYALASLFIWQVLTGAVAWATAKVLVGDAPDVGDSYRFGLARLWSILLIGLLFGLAVLGGFILLVVPGIIFAVRFSCSIPALVVEGKRGRQALSRSWNLVRGKGWQVFSAFLVAALLTGLVNGLLTAPFTSSWFARALAASVASVLTTPFMALVLALVYFDLRVRKEDLHVEALRAELQASAP